VVEAGGGGTLGDSRYLDRGGDTLHIWGNTASDPVALAPAILGTSCFHPHSEDYCISEVLGDPPGPPGSLPTTT
jgi:hypothetical protein